MSHANWCWCNYFKIKKYLDYDFTVDMRHQGLKIGSRIMIAKRTTRFKILGSPFWAHYTPKTLAEALNEHRILDYYMQQLASPKSANNPIKKGQTLEEWRAEQGSKTDYFKHFRDLLKEHKKTKNIKKAIEDLEDSL
jgi:hypothetical protein